MSYKLIERQVIFTGRQVRLEVQHLVDDENQRITREVCVHPAAAVVLPFLDDRTIIMVRNRRYALGQVLLELPAGSLQKGESPMNAAGRELLEETGYLARRMRPIVNFYSSPGILTERMYAFAAYDLMKQHQALEPGEELEPVSVSLQDAMELVRDGQITDAKTILTLLFHERFGVRPVTAEQGEP
jgi:ADP-ribose pyrophosphatase